ncbi:hypothetical protein [Agromyces bauzanensis]
MPADLPQLVAIPAGTFEPRDARSGSSREVVLRPFELGRTQVTRSGYRTVRGEAEAADDGPEAPDVPAHPIT